MTIAATCFLLAPTDKARLKLRRYKSGSGTCEGADAYHNASTPFAVVPANLDKQGYLQPCDQLAPSHDDPRWPTKCEGCAYEFQEEDKWQLFQEMLYVRPDTGEVFTLREAPVGAMWDAFWLPWKGSDGRSLVVMTPAGEWSIDGPSESGGYWTRTGEPPRISVQPSIHFPGKYHGWLTNGVLTPC